MDRVWRSLVLDHVYFAADGTANYHRICMGVMHQAKRRALFPASYFLFQNCKGPVYAAAVKYHHLTVRSLFKYQCHPDYIMAYGFFTKTFFTMESIQQRTKAKR